MHTQINLLIKDNFFPALTIRKDVLSKQSCLKTALFHLGKFADEFASLNRWEIMLEPNRVEEIRVQGYAWKTTLKVVAYILSAFLLPLFALAAKAIYRSHCLKIVNQTFSLENQKIDLEVKDVKKKLEFKAFQEKNTNATSFEDLLFATRKFFQKPQIANKVPPPINLPDLSKVVDDHGLIDHWLDNHQGFCIGENYHRHGPKEFLVDNMSYLKRKGVKILFLEQFKHENQADIDGYLNGGLLSSQIQQNLGADSRDGFQMPYGYRGILEAAKREGIRVVGIDTQWAYYPQSSLVELRFKTMQYFAYKTIKQSLKEMGDSKFVALLGVGQISKSNLSTGLSTLLACPNMIIDDKYHPALPTFILEGTDTDRNEVKTNLLYYRSST